MQLTPGNKARFDEILKRYPVEALGAAARPPPRAGAGGLDQPRGDRARGGAPRPQPGAGPRHRELLHDVPAEAGGEDAHRGVHDALLRPRRGGGAARARLPQARHQAGRDDARREVHGQGRRVPGRLRRRPRGAGERRVARARDGGRHRPRDRGRDGAPQLRVAEEPGRAHPLPERLEGGLDLDRRLRGLGRLREARRVAEDRRPRRSSTTSRSRTCAAAAGRASRPG